MPNDIMFVNHLCFLLTTGRSALGAIVSG